jgi:two-component system, cell cycle sensor histidine kinase and response regulator CckA
MPKDPNSSEAERMQALRRMRVLDTAPEQDFDDLTALASQLCEAPISTITLVDEDRQWFKSVIGLDVRETSRRIAFCSKTVAQRAPLIVGDTLLDPEFADNPLVVGPPHIRFYAGVPLVTASGFAIGTITVIDTRPRSLSETQLQLLHALARHAALTLEQRAQRLDLADVARRLSHAQRIAGIASWELDLLTNELHGSPELATILGRPESEPALTWESLHASVHEDDRTRVLASREAARRGDGTLELEYRIRRPDGTVRHLRELGGARGNDGGTTPVLAVAVRDVTEEHERDRLLRERETEYRLLFEFNPSPSWVYDTETLRFLAVNDTAVRHYGWTREEFLGMTIRDIRPPDQVPALLAALGDHVPTIEEGHLFQHWNRSGERLDVEVASHALTFDGRRARLVVVSDVTARRRAELRVRQSDALSRMAARTAKFGAWALDVPQYTVHWSDEICALHEEPVGFQPSLAQGLGYYAEEWRPVISEALARCEREGKPFDLEAEMISARGRRFWARVVGEASRDAEGRIVRIYGAVQDVTERRKLEQQFLRSQRMESIGTLAGGIAHDLNNVLAPILLSIDLLRGDLHPDDRNEILDSLEASASRGAEMIGQVLTFARGAESGRRLRVQPGTLIHDLEKLSSETFPRSIAVISEVEAGLPFVDGDPTQLHQVLLNLCVNARDAMPAGGTLTLGAKRVEIAERSAHASATTPPGIYVILSVEDSGVGIPHDQLDRIFDPFFTTKAVGSGTGLGLSTSLAIVQSHGGFIRVYSEPGVGTTFRVYLPAGDVDAEATPELSTAALPRGNGETVLVVDDEPSVRQITRQTLEAFGYRTIVAADGAEAVATYASRQREIDVVITDMMMPVMDGVTTIKVMRRMNRRVRIIAASGLAANGNVSKAADAGVNYFLPKPYTAQKLLTTLRDVLAADPESFERAGRISGEFGTAPSHD